MRARLKWVVHLFVLLSVGAAPAAWGRQEPAAPKTAAPEPGSLVLPFELASNKIIMDTKVNAQGPYPFVLDTGAPFTVLDWDLANQLGINVWATGEIGGAGEGKVKLGTTTGARLAIGGLRFRPRRMEVIPLNATLSLAEGRDVMGLIGGDVLERFVCDFDFVERTVRLHPPHDFKYEGEGERIPVTIQGHILARATVRFEGREPISGRFIVDTGARVAVSLNTHIVNEHRLLDDGVDHISTTIGWGIGGALDHALARAQSLEIGGVTFDAPTVTLSQDAKGVFASRSISGVIGTEVLKRCRVIIDYRREQVILEPVPAAMKTPFPADCAGVFITAGGEGFRTFTVRTVVERSPASEAGIKPGDVIERIDARPAERFSLEELRELLRIPDKTREVELERAGERVKLKLTTRSLI